MLRRGGRPGLLGMAARTAVVAGTATAVSGRVARRQQDRADQEADQRMWEAQQQPAALDESAAQAVAQAQAQVPSAGVDLMAQLTQLANLHAQGILSDAEFASAKAKLLS